MKNLQYIILVIFLFIYNHCYVVCSVNEYNIISINNINTKLIYNYANTLFIKKQYVEAKKLFTYIQLNRFYSRFYMDSRLKVVECDFYLQNWMSVILEYEYLIDYCMYQNVYLYSNIYYKLIYSYFKTNIYNMLFNFYNYIYNNYMVRYLLTIIEEYLIIFPLHDDIIDVKLCIIKDLSNYHFNIARFYMNSKYYIASLAEYKYLISKHMLNNISIVIMLDMIKLMKIIKY